jgi:hypothetical protein
LVAATPWVPLNTQLFKQGKVTNLAYGRYGPYIQLQDERKAEARLTCLLSEEEFDEAAHLDHVGESVQVAGEYNGKEGGMLIFKDCRVASAGNEDEVVRPLADHTAGSEAISPP